MNSQSYVNGIIFLIRYEIKYVPLLKINNLWRE
jgi:hypothetical protein